MLAQLSRRHMIHARAHVPARSVLPHHRPPPSQCTGMHMGRAQDGDSDLASVRRGRGPLSETKRTRQNDRPAQTPQAADGAFSELLLQGY